MVGQIGSGAQSSCLSGQSYVGLDTALRKRMPNECPRECTSHLDLVQRALRQPNRHDAGLLDKNATGQACYRLELPHVSIYHIIGLLGEDWMNTVPVLALSGWQTCHQQDDYPSLRAQSSSDQPAPDLIY